ncbi:MAG: hypothetical protein PUI65_10580, partial [Prevotella sp.]|nr:hypothetical protein [Prevotella sp.]
MKKRFTLMMMVLCILMSIPLKMMAEIVTVHFIDEDGWSDNGGKICAYVYKGNAFLIKDWPGTECNDIQIVGGKTVATWTLNLGDGVTASEAGIVFNCNRSQYPAEGVLWKVQDGLYYYKDGTTSTTAPSEGGTTGGGTGGGGGSDTPVEWDTEKTNRLTEKPRVYTQGFYLAGNFFSFSGNEVTYDDAVFKFQQQKNDATIETGKDYEVYKVEIPASLTAHAQVMYVDEFGKTKSIFGPGQKIDITNTYPPTNLSTSWSSTLANVCDPITKENSNYWNFISRNASASQYSDGMYNLYIAVEAKTHTIKKWKIEHIGNKRVAFFISDAKNATAMPVYDRYKKEANQF